MDDGHRRRSNQWLEREREGEGEKKEREREKRKKKRSDIEKRLVEVVMYGGTAITVSLPCVPWNQPSVTYKLPLVIQKLLAGLMRSNTNTNKCITVF